MSESLGTGVSWAQFLLHPSEPGDHHAEQSYVRLLHHPADSVTWNFIERSLLCDMKRSKSAYLIALSQGWGDACKERSLLATGRFSLRVHAFIRHAGFEPLLCGRACAVHSNEQNRQSFLPSRASVLVCGEMENMKNQ